MAGLQIQLLGEFQATYGGKPLPALQRERQRSLLVYLLLCAPQSQSRHHIAAQLWPDSAEHQALANLRRTLHRLRQVLPAADEFIYVERSKLGWRSDAPWTCDMVEMEQMLAWVDGQAAPSSSATGTVLKEAVALYQGELFAGCFDEWIQPHRERVRQRFLDALVWLSTWRENQQDIPGAIRAAQRLLEYDPLDEQIYLRLMVLHRLEGKRTAALNVFHTCQTILQRELGVAPGAEMQRIYAALVKGDDTEPQAPPDARSTTPQTPRSTSIPLVGRQAEWQTMRDAWLGLRAGQAQMVLLKGEAGIGKTRLAEELLFWCQAQDIATARARSYAASGDLAYTPLIEWLRSDLLHKSVTHLEPVWRTELMRLLPELGSQYPDLARPEPLHERWQRQRLFEALARALLADGRSKVLLLDDLQWCDADTLDWLRYLLYFMQSGAAGPEQRAKLLIVGTLRIEEIEAGDLVHLLENELQLAGQLNEMPLRPLAATDAMQLAALAVGDELEVEAMAPLHDHTGGNPLFIIEIARAGADTTGAADGMLRLEEVDAPLSGQLPPKVHAVIQHRLAQLSAPARELLNLAAVNGRAFHYPVLAEASHQAEEAMVRGLDELWRRHLIREQGGQAYDFGHDCIRDAVYGSIGAARRALYHRRVAQALEQIAAGETDEISAQLAGHYDRAGDAEAAIGWYVRAAEVAQAVVANSDVVRYLERCLTILAKLPATGPRKEQQLTLLLRLMRPTWLVEGYASSKLGEVCARAKQLYDEVGHPEQLLEILHSWIPFYMIRANFRVAQSMSQNMLAVAQELQSNPESKHSKNNIAFAHHRMANALLNLGDLVRASEHYVQASKNHPKVRVIGRHALTTWLLGYPNRARTLLCRTIHLARLDPDPYQMIFCADYGTLLHIWMRRPDRVYFWAQKTMTLASKLEFPTPMITGRLDYGVAMGQSGELAKGLAQVRESIAKLTATEQFIYHSFHLGHLAELYTKSGCFEQALSTLDEAFAFVERTQERFWLAELYRLRGEVLCELQAPEQEIETAFRTALAIAHGQEAKSLELRAGVSLARVWQQAGRNTEAQTLLAPLYGWFTEGFKTADLVEARQLLAALG